MSKIFGGSKSKSTQQSTSTSTASNRAYDEILQGYSPQGQAAFNQGIQSRNDILGGGFDAYKRAGGFDFQLNRGLQNLLGSYGAKGVLRSGAALKGLQQFGSDISNTYLNDYLNQQAQQSQLGMGIGQLLAGTGGVSSSQSQATGTSTSKSSPGLGGFLGGVGSAIAASDRRLKKNIKKIGELGDGLGIYTYNYINDTGPFVGVMADEVEQLRPDALGPVIDGFKTVDYSKIKEAA